MPHFLMTTLQIAVQIQGIDANMIKMCGVNVNDHPVLFFFFFPLFFFFVFQVAARVPRGSSRCGHDSAQTFSMIGDGGTCRHFNFEKEMT